MLRKKASVKILAHKPDIFGTLPPEVLDEPTADQLRQIPRLAVAEIAGPADVPALRKLLTHHKPDGLLPTFSYTGTEYGDWARMGDIAANLKKNFEKDLNIFVAEPVVLGSPALWKALREVHEGELGQRFGFTCPCLGCRLYSFTLRVPLCKKVDSWLRLSSARIAGITSSNGATSTRPGSDSRPGSLPSRASTFM